MTTYNVSSASQLASAINSAHGGDVIRLAGGNYGRLNLSKNFNGNVTITSAQRRQQGHLHRRGGAQRRQRDLRQPQVRRGWQERYRAQGQPVEQRGGDGFGFLRLPVRDELFQGHQPERAQQRRTAGCENDCMRFAQVINATITGNDFEQT